MFEKLLTPSRKRWQPITTIAFAGLLFFAGLGQAASKPKPPPPPPPPPPSLLNTAIVYKTFPASFGGGSDLKVANADGSNQVVLVANAAFSAPSWSRDGNEVIFASNIQGSGIYRLTIDRGTGAIGSPVKIVPVNNCCISNPVWSPMLLEVSTGVFHNFIAYTDLPPGGVNYDIYLLDLDVAISGTNPINLTNTPDLSEIGVSWSPYATQISVSTYKEGDLEYLHDIAILTVATCLQQPSCEGQSLVQGTGSLLDGIGVGTTARWGNTGDEIAVQAPPASGENHDIFIIPINSPLPTWNLTDTNTSTSNDRHEYRPSWSPDDEQILYVVLNQLCGKGKTMGGIVVRNLTSQLIDGCKEKLLIQDGRDPSWWRGAQP